MKSNENWDYIIREFESSGLTQAAFARMKNMNVKSFQNGYYRHKDRQEPKGSSFAPVVADQPADPVIRISVNYVPLEFAPDICDEDLKKIMKAVISL